MPWRHEGRTEPIPQDQANYSYQMSIPAGIRKTGPWVVVLSGVINTQSLSQFYLDRQSSVSVFHEKYGFIISGANSKRQPELATFSEKIEGQIFHLSLSSRLQMNDREDRLSLSYQTFFSDLYVPAPSEKDVVDPAGKIAPAYSGNVLAPNGRMDRSLPFALNDSAGSWTIRARDMLTGQTQSKSVEVF